MTSLCDVYRSINLLGPLTGEYCEIERNYQNREGGNLRTILVRVCFLRKRGLNVYLEGLKKGAIRAANPYYVIYRLILPPPPRSNYVLLLKERATCYQ